jgi:hypothetical protein
MTLTHTLSRTLDKWALAGLNRRLPDTFETSYEHNITLEKVLAGVQVVLPLDYAPADQKRLFTAGQHSLFLGSDRDLLRAGVKVYPAADPAAPLLIYHHGFNEYPFDGISSRIFNTPGAFNAHIVCIQAPYHHNWQDPLRKGFASLRNMYQMLAGSLRLMAFCHAWYQGQGSPYTVVAGLSWGGITSILYQGIFGQARAVAPLLAGPNLAQVLLDIAELLQRPLRVNSQELQRALDFTPYYRACDQARIFPLLAENDLFFRLEHHATTFTGCSVATVPASHITGCWQTETMRRHILDVLQWSQN